MPATDGYRDGCPCDPCRNEDQRLADVRSGTGPAFEQALEACFVRGECRCSNCRPGVVARVIEAAGGVPSEPTEESEEREESPPCHICGEEAADCECRECSSCGAMFASEDACEACRRCPGCCGHVTCEGCDFRRDSDTICDECSTCSRCCCTCWYCEACGQTHGEDVGRCGDCERCDDECSCSTPSDEDREGENSSPSGSGRPTKVRLPDTPVFHKGTTFLRNPSRRFISVEIEVARSSESTRRHVDPHVAGWASTAVVDDGSLPDSGYEINTAPTSGDEFVERIEGLCDALSNADAIVTTACGLHVHVDARDLTYRALQRLVALYAHVEPALFNMVPSSRKNNRYCQRCGPDFLRRGIAASLDRAAQSAAGQSPKIAKAAVVKAVYEEDVEQPYGKERFEARKKYKYDDARYAALNLHSWFYRGTVELRLAAGTTNAEKIVCWSILVASMLDWAKKHKDADLTKLPSDPLEALLSVAPTVEVREWTRKRHAKFYRA